MAAVATAWPPPLLPAGPDPQGSVHKRQRAGGGAREGGMEEGTEGGQK